MLALVLALLMGVIAGLRTFTAPAAVSWAAHFAWLPLAATPLAFVGYTWVLLLITALALVEFVTDQLPSTPSRTVPVQFAARIVAGALSGATLGAPGGYLIAGGMAGVAGAVVGTLGGRAARAKLAAACGADRPAGLIEDAVAVLGAILIALVVA